MRKGETNIDWSAHDGWKKGKGCEEEGEVLHFGEGCRMGGINLMRVERKVMRLNALDIEEYLLK